MIVKDALFANPIPRPLTVSFLAPASNTGRTSIVSNLSWLFGRRRRNVLVLDMSAEGAAVHDYLSPFLAEEDTPEAVFGTRVADLLESPGHDVPVLRRYSVGGGRLDVLRTGVFGAGTAHRLREALFETPYDYVLVDAPAGNAPGALEAITALSDRVAICLSPQSISVRNSAELARRLLDQRAGGFPLVLVASHFGGDQEQIERSQNDFDREFAEFFVGSTPAQLVTLPPQHYWDYLAMLKEPAASDLRLAYGELATALLPEEPIAWDEPPVSLSNRYVTAMDHKADPKRAEPVRERFQVLFHPTDQQVTEWLALQLGNNGIEVERRSVTADEPLVEGLPVLAVSSAECDLGRLGRAFAPDAASETVVIRLEGAVLDGDLPAFSVVELTPDLPQDTAAGRLFGALGMAGVGQPVTTGSRPLFAGPTYRNAIPPRDVPFLGRDQEIGALRVQLTGVADPVVVLRAPSGVGKTALVREYYERFAAGYDMVWWIAAHDLRAVRRALTRLGDVLSVRPRGDMVAATIEALSSPSRRGATSSPGRWLLVYDGVVDLADLDGLVPRGGGHVVVTTTDAAAARLGYEVELGPLRRQEAVEGLRALIGQATDHRVGMTNDEADAIVRATKAIPVGIRLVCTYLLRLVNSPDIVLDETGALSALADVLRGAVEAIQATESQPDRLAALLDLVLDLLHRDPYGVRARHLAEMCGFLAPDGADVRLLRAPVWLDELGRAIGAGEGGITADDIDRTIWTGVRFGLFSINWQETEPEPLRVVPALQRLILDRMSQQQREERRDQVRHGLARVANALPWEADTRMVTPEAKWTAAIYGELLRHMAPCGVLETDDRAAREWVVRQFRYLVRTSDQANLRFAEPLAATLFERWHRDHPGELLTLRLAIELTNMWRGLGRHRGALELDQRMRREFVPRLGRDHFRVLVLRRGIAADLRALGRFAAGLGLDQATWTYFHDTHGPGHPETLTTGHNLAVSQFVSGQISVALVTEQQVYQGRLRLLGETAWQTLWSAMEIGIYTRELGDFAKAATLLQSVEKRMQEAHLPRWHTLRLRARKHWAIAQRLAGNATESRGALQQILNAYEDLFGHDHPQSWSTRLSVAAEAYDSAEFDRAAHLAGEVLAHYESNLGVHPFTAAARANLAVYLQRAGRHDQAASHGRRAHEDLLLLLGEPHPWTITALIGRVLVEAEQQNLAEATGLAEEAYLLALEYLPNQEGLPRHPCVLLATAWRQELRDGQSVSTMLGRPAEQRRYLDITIPET